MFLIVSSYAARGAEVANVRAVPSNDISKHSLAVLVNPIVALPLLQDHLGDTAHLYGQYALLVGERAGSWLTEDKSVRRTECPPHLPGLT